MEITTSKISLNYESLIENYEAGLSTQLRNFKSGPDFLETWVHDSDHGRSMIGIFEAAKDAGVEELGLEVGFQVAGAMNFSSLGSELKRLGEVRIGTSQNGTQITVRFC